MRDIVLEYQNILFNIDKIIAASPYKASYIIEKLGMSSANYHKKKREKSFSLQEMLKLTDLIDSEVMEDKLLAEISIEAEERNDFVPLRESGLV